MLTVNQRKDGGRGRMPLMYLYMKNIQLRQVFMSDCKDADEAARLMTVDSAQCCTDMFPTSPYSEQFDQHAMHPDSVEDILRGPLAF